jgi:hypothetical protein
MADRMSVYDAVTLQVVRLAKDSRELGETEVFEK